MTRHLLSKRLHAGAASVSLVAAALLAAPRAALAQEAGSGGSGGTGGSSSSTGSISAALISIDGESEDTVGETWISLEDCLSDVEVIVEIDGIPDRPQLDVYAGSNCTSTEARDRDGESDCTLIANADVENRPQDVRIPISALDLVRGSFGTEDCGSQSSTPKLWFLAVNVSDTTDAVTTDQYGTLDLNIDTDPPDAPTSIEGGRGENEIPVNWSVGSNTVDSFEIYVDSGEGTTPIRDASTQPEPSDDGGTDAETPAGSSNDACGSGALVAGGNAEDVASLRKKREGSPTATGTTLSASAIGGDVAAIAVVAVDKAGNKSPLSEVECVYVVPTTGFKDALAEGGEIPQGCPCAAAGPVQLEGMMPIALALGIIAYRRRRRS